MPQPPPDSSASTDEEIEAVRFGRGGPLPRGGYEVAADLLRQAAGICERAAAGMREFSDDEASAGDPDVYTFARYDLASELEEVARRADSLREALEHIMSTDVY